MKRLVPAAVLLAGMLGSASSRASRYVSEWLIYKFKDFGKFFRYFERSGYSGYIFFQEFIGPDRFFLGFITSDRKKFGSARVNP